MAKFAYIAKNSPFNVVKGVLIADNKISAIQRLSSKGYFLLSIEDEAVKSNIDALTEAGFFRKKTDLRNITAFTRQFSDLLESGLTIVKALEILQGQTEDRMLRKVIADIKDFCSDGNSLSSALERHPLVFSDLFVNMVRSGEAGGTLENVLRRLAELNEKQFEIRTKIRSALAYPVLMVIVGSITILVLLTFVIPKITGMFNELGQSLPMPTLILMKINNIFKDYWWLFLSGIGAAGIGYNRIYKTDRGRFKIDGLKLAVPIFGGLIKKSAISAFTRTLAALLDNGVPMMEALRVAEDTMNNNVIKKEIKNAYFAVEKGSGLSEAFSVSNVLPRVVVNMISVGEESGHIEKPLLKIAEAFERDVDVAIKAMMSLLEPVLILTLGLVIGFIVISMLLPIFEINFLAW